MPCFFSRLRINAHPILWGVVSFVLLCIASMMCSVVAMAAVVSLQPPPANEALLRIPVILMGEGDEDLAGVQFDLNYDVSQYTLESVETGAAASDAGKDVILSQPAPGRGRILITGFNDNALFDGHVATLILRPRTPDAAAYTIAVDNLLATDPLGSSVPIDYADDYAYPPLPPEKTEADLVESATENTSEEESTPNTDAATTATPRTQPDPVAVESPTPRSAVSPGFGGDLSTPANNTTHPRTAKKAPRQSGNNTTYHVPILVSSPGISTPARRPHTVSARPVPRNTRASLPSSRNTGTSAVPPTSSTERNISTRTDRADGEDSSQDPSLSYRRLALVMPTSSPFGSDEVRSRAGGLLDESTPRSPFSRGYSTEGIAFFLLFFVGFGLLHIKVFRWVSSNTWRHRT